MPRMNASPVVVMCALSLSAIGPTSALADQRPSSELRGQELSGEPETPLGALPCRFDRAQRDPLRTQARYSTPWQGFPWSPPRSVFLRGIAWSKWMPAIRKSTKRTGTD